MTTSSKVKGRTTLTRARPPLAHPPVQTSQLRALVDWDDAVDLAIWVRVVLALEVLLAVHGGHIDSCHRAEACRLGRRGDAGAAVAGPVDGDVGDPALVQPGLDEAGECVVVRGAWAVGFVEVVLEGLAWCAVGWSVYGLGQRRVVMASHEARTHRFSTSDRKAEI